MRCLVRTWLEEVILLRRRHYICPILLLVIQYLLLYQASARRRLLPWWLRYRLLYISGRGSPQGGRLLQQTRFSLDLFGSLSALEAGARA